MSSSPVIRTALEAAERPVMVDSAAQAGRALKAWRRSDVLALDTEFVRERTYRARLGLVQVSDGQTVWLLDPLAEGTLPPLVEMMRDPGITQLLHGPSEDLEVLLHVTGALPEPLVDTQLACAMLGEPLQVGYHKAIEDLLGVPVEKDVTRSNWVKRPLTERQLHYAALDVCLLPEAWQRLRDRLAERGRLDWLEEDSRRQLRVARKPVKPAKAWQRIRGAGRLAAEQLAVLQVLAEWREEEAIKRDRPRGFIVPDPVLLSLARQQPESPDALKDVASDLHPKVVTRHGDRLLRMIRDVSASGATLEPPAPWTGAQNRLLKHMRDDVQEAAKELGVEPALLASKKDLEKLLRRALDGGKVPERLRGWRREAVTQRLLERMAEAGISRPAG